jgi:hypothetical protein
VKYDKQIEADANEFGVITRQGGWRLGLLVARSVEKGRGNGGDRRSQDFQRNDRNAENDFKKWSARDFARSSGTSAPRVLRFLKTWDALAEDGYVPESALLVPGEELDGMDDLDPDVWDQYYPGGEPDLSEDKSEAYTAAAEDAGTTTNMVAKVAKNKKALKAAIKADPAVERAAKEAIYEMMETDRKHGRDAVAARGGTVTPIADIRKQDQDRNARLTELIRADGELADVVKGWLARIDEVEALTNKIVESGPFGDAHWREQLRAGTKKLSDIVWSVEATIVEGAAQA